MNKKLIIFDLDGVIFDSKENMKISWNKVRKKLKIKISFKKYFSKIGIPYKKILSKLGIKKNIKLAEEIFEKESIKNLGLIKLYPNVKKTLNFLKKKKFKIGVITSKSKKRTFKLVRKFRLNFDFIICPEDGKPGKPNPYFLNRLSKKYKINKKSTYYVGDTLIDFHFAKNAKIKFIFCQYGYGRTKKNVLKIKNLNEISKHLAI